MPNVLVLPVDDESAEIARYEADSLTDLRKKFVDLVVIGNNPTESARLAGYSDPRQAAYYLLRQPKVAAAIRARSEALLMTEGAVVGVGTLLQVAKNEKYSPAARVRAAESLLDRAGIGVKPKENQPLGAKPIGDMDLGELDAFIKAGSAALERHRQAASATDAQIIEDSAQAVPIEGEKAP